MTQAEARLRALGVDRRMPTGAALWSTPQAPQALPQDGSVELEAKAGLVADQAGSSKGKPGR